MDDDGFLQTVHGLLRKRGDLVSEIEALRAQMDIRLTALDHVDATIRVFKPDIDCGDLPERPAPPANAAFRGEVQRFLLTALRAANGPMTTTQLGVAIMEARGISLDDRVLAKLIRQRTGHALSRLRAKGFIESAKYGAGAELDWRVTGRGEGGEPVGGWRNGSG